MEQSESAKPEPEPVPVEKPEPVPVEEPEPVPVEEPEPVPVEEPAVEAEPAPAEKAEPVGGPVGEAELEPAVPVAPDEIVADLHAKYEEALASQVERPYEEAQGKLAAGYLGALERDEKAAQEAANLDAVLHWRNEQMSVKGKPEVGEARGDVPAKLVKMRRIYGEESGKLVEVRKAKELELRGKYDEALAGHVKELTRSRKIEEALAVEKWREPYRASEEKSADPKMLAVGGAAAPAAPAASASGGRLTLVEIDRGEVGSELEIILPGGIPMVFCWCPPGKFLMGSPPDEEGREIGFSGGAKTDETQHLVELTKGYWLGKTEVTQAQWTALMETTVEEQHALTPGQDTQRWNRLRGIGPDQPMYFVNWEESEAFCEKLNQTFRLPRPWKFALPTEAQWEYACRGGTTGPFSGSGALGEMGWFAENSEGTTHPVGQKRPNAWGLHDMHGNVWEWCADWYEDYPRSAVTDPRGQGGSLRVDRGGSWFDGARVCRSAFRDHSSPERRFNAGFRVAVSSFR